MTARPIIIVPLIHNIGGLNTKIGEVHVMDSSITWHFMGSYGEGLLETIRADLIKAANTGGAQVFDLMAPFQPKTH